MKKCIALWLLTLFVRATYGQSSIDFKSAPIPMVLNIYAELGNKQLAVEPAVTNQNKFITIRIDDAKTKGEISKRLEKALHDQAGVVIESIDAKHATVKLEKK